MSDDLLASIPVDTIHAWYDRLGRSSGANAAAAGVAADVNRMDRRSGVTAL
jgi:hypothetical protein